MNAKNQVTLEHFHSYYRPLPKFSYNIKIFCNLKIRKKSGITAEQCHQKMQMEMQNSGDPDKTAPTEAVWSGSALFALRPICPKT